MLIVPCCPGGPLFTTTGMLLPELPLELVDDTPELEVLLLLLELVDDAPELEVVLEPAEGAGPVEDPPPQAASTSAAHRASQIRLICKASRPLVTAATCLLQRVE
jgi:hypothetical protein